MHVVGIAQSLGLFVVICLASAGLLSLTMAALARMERATVRAPVLVPRPTRVLDLPASAPAAARARAGARVRDRARAERVSSPGSCTYRPRVR